MKKILFALMLFVNILGFSALKNGIYSVEKKHDGNWTSFVKLTVKDGKIIGAQYDRKNQKGELFSMNQNSSCTVKIIKKILIFLSGMRKYKDYYFFRSHRLRQFLCRFAFLR